MARRRRRSRTASTSAPAPASRPFRRSIAYRMTGVVAGTLSPVPYSKRQVRRRSVTWWNRRFLGPVLTKRRVDRRGRKRGILLVHPTPSPPPRGRRRLVAKQRLPPCTKRPNARRAAQTPKGSGAYRGTFFNWCDRR